MRNVKLLILGILLTLFTLNQSAAAEGKKYGLFVGINAYAQSPLRGCVNDAKNWRSMLTTKYGVAEENAMLLTDQEATRDGIINAIKSFQTKAQSGDVFIFTYSGHGTLFPDAYSEEKDEDGSLEMPGYYPLDKYDSAICPVDLRGTSSGKPWNNLILDDELYSLFSEFTAKKAMVVFISDSCHSGSLARNLGTGALPAKIPSNARFLPLSKFRSLDSIPRPKKQRQLRRTRDDADGLLVVLSGSKDDEFSLDYPDPSGVNGLFTKTFLQIIEESVNAGKQPTYMTVRDNVSPQVVRLAAEKQNSQTPQVDGRFFKIALDTPLFEFPKPSGTNAPNGTNTTVSNGGNAPQTGDAGELLRVVIKVTDKSDSPIEGAAVGIFNQRASRLLQAGDVQKIESRDIRGTGRTNSKGLYDSNIQSLLLPRGTYFIKVLRDGYMPYIGEIKIVENAPGYCVINVKLQKQ